MSDSSNNFKKVRSTLRFYGLNAIIGFGLGIAIVIVVFIANRQGASDLDNQKGSLITSNNQQNSQLNATGQISDSSSSEELINADMETASLALEERFTVLLVGMDNRPEEKHLSNTDTLIVASFDKKNKKMVLLSIPRDTQVILPQKGKEKVNALARLGKGVPSTVEYIGKLINAPIQGYVVTNFQGFKNIVDSLGGITVNVEKNMYFDTGDDKDRYINLKKGEQRLNGTQALQYARFRNDELADISRTSRQQEVIKAIVAEATAARNIPKIPILIPKVYQSIETDLNISQLWTLAMTLKNRDEYEVVNQTLPGSFSIEEGISYWKVNSTEAKGMLEKLFQGKKMSIFENGPSTTVAQKKPVAEELKSDAVNQGEQQKKENTKSETNTQKDINQATDEQGITFEMIGP
jgi:LCP family protein required for cell wall assembly